MVIVWSMSDLQPLDRGGATEPEAVLCLGENPAEVNLAELLHIAQREFKQVKTLDEVELEQGWPRLRAALGKAFLDWHKVSVRKEIQPETPAIPSKTLPLWRQRFLLS